MRPMAFPSESKEVRQSTNIELRTITPQEATKWLNEKGRNRDISERFVTRYANDMLAGRWELNGKTIVFGKNGELLDGQHRLLACEKVNTPFATYVVYGVESTCEVDTGKIRSLADGVRIYCDVTITAPMAMALQGSLTCLLTYALGYEFKNTSAKGINRFTHPVRLEILRHDPHYKEIMPLVAEFSTSKSVLRPSTAVSLLWLTAAAGLPLENTAAFLRSVKTGEGLTVGNPALSLRNFMINVGLRHRLLHNMESFRAALYCLRRALSGEKVLSVKTTVLPFPGCTPDDVAGKLGLVSE